MKYQFTDVFSLMQKLEAQQPMFVLETFASFGNLSILYNNLKMTLMLMFYYLKHFLSITYKSPRMHMFMKNTFLRIGKP